MKKTVNYFGIMLTALLFLNACKKSDNPTPTPEPEPEPEKPAFYSVGVQVGSVNYILPTDNIKEGSISPVGLGVEVPGNELIQSGNFFYFFSRSEKKFYQFELKADGKLEEKAALLITSYISDRAYSQSLIDEHTILIMDPVVWGEPTVKWFTIKIPEFEVTNSGTYELPTLEKEPGVNWKGNVGKAVLHGNKIVMGSVYYDFDGNYAPGTHVVTIDYPAMTNPTKVTSEVATGEIGYTNQLFAKTANGDLYVGAYRGPYGVPSEDDVKGFILRINNGSYTFDDSYFFDLSAVIGEPTQVMQLNFLENQSAMAMLFNTNDMAEWADLDKDNYYFAKLDLPGKTVAKLNLPKSSVRLARYPLIANGKYITFHKSLANNKTNIVEIDYNGGADAFTIGKQIEGDGVTGVSIVKHPAQ